MSALLLCKALFDTLFAAVVLRADFRRRENQLLALMALLDAACGAGCGLLVDGGFALKNATVIRIGLISRILIVHPLLEFAYTFPSGRRPPPTVRALSLAATALAALSTLDARGGDFMAGWPGGLAFFGSYFLAVVAVAWRNLMVARSDEAARGARPVLLSLIVVFAHMLLTFVLVRALFPSYFELALASSMLVTVVSYAVAAHTMLRYRLFRLRGVVAESVMYGGLALSGLALVAAATEWVAIHLQPALARSVAFGAIATLPIGAWSLIARLAPQLESALLCPLDPRRRQLKHVLERALHESVNMVDALALCELTRGAVASLSRGSAAVFRLEDTGAALGGIERPLLPRELADYLRASQASALHRRSLEELSAAQAEAFKRLNMDALVPVRAQGKLWCVLAMRGHYIDQDTLDTAKALADNLGNKLVHHAMYQRAFELQTQLEASRQLATLGSFAAAIAHDIRTPLTSVKMNLEMISARPELEQDPRECAELALHELRRMNDYVSGMLDYAKPVELRAVEVDVRHLIDETARTLQPLFDSRKLELCRESAASCALPPVRADALRMKQVLLNLLENAADASGPGHTIRVGASALGADRVAIRVVDQGHGIEPGNLARIFEPFFTTRADGTGLGLAIVRKLVRAHHGEVRVDSTLGTGSTFTVVLPA